MAPAFWAPWSPCWTRGRRSSQVWVVSNVRPFLTFAGGPDLVDAVNLTGVQRFHATVATTMPAMVDPTTGTTFLDRDQDGQQQGIGMPVTVRQMKVSMPAMIEMRMLPRTLTSIGRWAWEQRRSNGDDQAKHGPAATGDPSASHLLSTSIEGEPARPGERVGRPAASHRLNPARFHRPVTCRPSGVTRRVHCRGCPGRSRRQGGAAVSVCSA